MNLCLGRKWHHPAQLATVPQRRGLVLPPAALVRERPQWYLGHNDLVPDCTAVDLANSALAWSLTHGAAAPVLDEDLLPQFYGRCIGAAPGSSLETLATTDGAVVQDVMGVAQSQGFDVGQQVPLVPRATTVGLERGAIASAAAMDGLAYVGIRLYERDMQTVGQGPWVAPVRDSGDLAGGHATGVWAYAGLRDADLVEIPTWGMQQPASWTWLMERLDEAWGCEWPQLTGPQDA
jgi:hypothetical protein